jgi:hypothetical protein
MLVTALRPHGARRRSVILSKRCSTWREPVVLDYVLALELYLSLVPPQVRLLISLTFGTGLKGRGVS